jgi:hypothetical protein
MVVVDDQSCALGQAFKTKDAADVLVQDGFLDDAVAVNNPVNNERSLRVRSCFSAE